MLRKMKQTLNKVLDVIYGGTTKISYDYNKDFYNVSRNVRSSICRNSMCIIWINATLMILLPLYIWGIPFITITLITLYYFHSKIKMIDGIVKIYQTYEREDRKDDRDKQFRKAFNKNEALMSYKNYVKRKMELEKEKDGEALIL